MSFLSMSFTGVKMPRLLTSRWMQSNHFATWLSQDE